MNSHIIDKIYHNTQQITVNNTLYYDMTVCFGKKVSKSNKVHVKNERY